jgi:hypothetical protein
MSDEKRDDGLGGTATPEQMQAAIESSGYLLEGRIAQVMANSHFDVQPNSFHSNPSDGGKAIEVDVEGSIVSLLQHTRENDDSVTARLLVECKNNSQPVAFFIRNQLSPAVNDSRIRYCGFPEYSMDAETKIPVALHELLEMRHWHHYCESREIATQFCGFTRAKKEWKAEPMEHYSKSFSQLATVTGTRSLSWFDLKAQSIQVQLIYPVVVFQGQLFCVRNEGGKARVEPTEQIQLHHSALVNGTVVSVQIDIVSEAGFPALMARILGDLKDLKYRIKSLHPQLLKSAVEQKRGSQDAATRAAMETLGMGRGGEYLG